MRKTTLLVSTLIYDFAFYREDQSPTENIKTDEILTTLTRRLSNSRIRFRKRGYLLQVVREVIINLGRSGSRFLRFRSPLSAPSKRRRSHKTKESESLLLSELPNQRRCMFINLAM
ncbi:hypothetical protein TNIN_372921 [Trichonephila inaurata madagascariensis]|uniref:Uncharacterized protein n=1 Tax=Trichonephila inaurata madagascariensis TaxID=2747483 RepID=A0A8X6YFS4_9ARAC|nr:hypothetical protein TNIN_372921 [Trichonephila inaurata madagascariensis]